MHIRYALVEVCVCGGEGVLFRGGGHAWVMNRPSQLKVKSHVPSTLKQRVK